MSYIVKNKVSGEKARMSFSYLVGDDNATVISPIVDLYVTGAKLGHIVLYDNSSFEFRNNLYYSKPFSQGQKNSKFNGSFVFVGSDIKFFHHLINNKITGKYGDNFIAIDDKFAGMVSLNFIDILKEYILV